MGIVSNRGVVFLRMVAMWSWLVFMVSCVCVCYWSSAVVTRLSPDTRLTRLVFGARQGLSGAAHAFEPPTYDLGEEVVVDSSNVAQTKTFVVARTTASCTAHSID